MYLYNNHIAAFGYLVIIIVRSIIRNLLSISKTVSPNNPIFLIGSVSIQYGSIYHNKFVISVKNSKLYTCIIIPYYRIQCLYSILFSMSENMLSQLITIKLYTCIIIPYCHM